MKGLHTASFYLENNSESDLGRGKWRAQEPTIHRPQFLVGKGWNWNQMSEKQSPRLRSNCQIGHELGRNELVSAKWFGESRRAAGLRAQATGESVFPPSLGTRAIRAET